MHPALVALLDELDTLVVRQADAARAGDADALPGVAEQLQQKLALLARAAGGRELPEPARERLAAMSRQGQFAHMMVARRQQMVQKALDVLGSQHAGLQEARNGVTYGARGGLTGGGLRRHGFERA